MWHTSLTKQLDIQFPLIQAPMAGGSTTPELVAAVSNTGCLGSLAAGYLSPTEIKSDLKRVRQLTNQPFAVNLFIPEPHQASPEQILQSCRAITQSCKELGIEIDPTTAPKIQSFDEQISVLIEENIPVFSFTFGTLDPFWIAQFKKNGTVLIGTATNLSEALLLEDSGIDFIVAQGSEAGGHRGTFIGPAEDSLAGLFRLLPLLVDQISTPIIAAGGIMDGRGINAAISLGCSGVQMGTAFLTCFESGIPPIMKHTLLAQRQDNTVLTRVFSGKLARGIRNKFIVNMEQYASSILDYPVQNALTTRMRIKAREQNNIDYMSIWAGQSAFLCRNTSVAELINALIREAEE
ncbi:NAD(P)H-dependent flavin oxidoreductase [Legionella bononiensis]|uniref:Propionate 3-nitronate monooxygenase n=1 Tax=Legionella bononiensis TaxID=2793102 RepID=A0ABS1WF83_9GAMM|nr:nitronate monooxygenase [Legionella bononiensis]MBL7479261.1 nitronate monooxygenase [Legionella bononiensis]MBL7528011.1 nitronate monooxygenase [Legionella bononiensis]MBL7563912.1 nitronate monooxygenase [Legionella bononiensis]